MIRREPLEECVDLIRDPLDRTAWLRARNRLKEGGAPAFHDSLVHSQGNPQARSTRKLDARSHHANHRMTLAVEPDHLSDDVRGGAKMISPHSIGYHNYGRRPHSLVGTGEIPALDGSDSENAKEVV